MGFLGRPCPSALACGGAGVWSSLSTHPHGHARNGEPVISQVLGRARGVCGGLFLEGAEQPLSRPPVCPWWARGCSSGAPCLLQWSPA